MKTENVIFPEPPAGFSEKLTTAMSDLRERLQSRYESRCPGKAQQIRHTLDEAEALAWKTPFPHLFLPDLAEVRFAGLKACAPAAYTDTSVPFAQAA